MAGQLKQRGCIFLADLAVTWLKVLPTVDRYARILQFKEKFLRPVDDEGENIWHNAFGQ